MISLFLVAKKFILPWTAAMALSLHCEELKNSSAQ